MYSPQSPGDSEVTDDEFLANSRRGQDPVEAKREMMAQKRREIESRTLDSSHRSLGLLYESEKVGLATAQELNRQKEQLKSTEQRLDDINATLKTSERHLQGVKSVFGGIINYFQGRNRNGLTGQSPSPSAPSDSSSLHHQQQQQQSQEQQLAHQSHHPGLRVRGMQEGQIDQRAGSATVDAILDRNLDDMSSGLSRLKQLAQGLNSELEEHDDIIGRLDDKIDQNSWRVQKQNKDMAKLLKK